MDDILRQEQEKLFGVNGALLDELLGDILKLTVAVAREDREEVADALALVREDVDALTAGLAFCFAGPKIRPVGKPENRSSLGL